MVTDQLVIVRGGGDIATGTIRALRRAGFPVLILESDRPSAIRRTVALSEAVYQGSAAVEDVTVTLAHNLDEAEYLLFQNGIAMLVDPAGDTISKIIDTEEKYSEWDTGLTTLEGGGRHLFLTAVIDAILAKKNLGTKKGMAPIVIALGPGFAAGKDCDVVIETMRGHNLGRAVSEGCALPNTGTPGLIAGHAADRVIHSPAAGVIRIKADIGDIVEKGQVIAEIVPAGEAASGGPMAVAPGGEAASGGPQAEAPGGEAASGGPMAAVPVRATFTGLLRGMIRDGFKVPEGFKIADIDPRVDQHDNCFKISDKARAIGGAVVTELVHFIAVRDLEEQSHDLL